MGMTIDTVTKWLGIIRANLKVFPEVGSDKKIEALNTAISYLKDYEMYQADYNTRIKADMVAMLEEIRFQAEENIENIYEKDEDDILMLAQHNAFADCFAQYNSLIEDKIDALKEKDNGKDTGN